MPGSCRTRKTWQTLANRPIYGCRHRPPNCVSRSEGVGELNQVSGLESNGLFGKKGGLRTFATIAKFKHIKLEGRHWPLESLLSHLLSGRAQPSFVGYVRVSTGNSFEKKNSYFMLLDDVGDLS